jgi:hypothetical protein
LSPIFALRSGSWRAFTLRPPICRSRSEAMQQPVLVPPRRVVLTDCRDGSPCDRSNFSSFAAQPFH